MKYEEIPVLGKAEIERQLMSADPLEVARALLSAALNVADRHWVEELCISKIASGDDNIRSAAITSFMHLARIHRELDTERIFPILARYHAEPEFQGLIDDALEEISFYLQKKTPRKKKGGRRSRA